MKKILIVIAAILSLCFIMTSCKGNEKTSLQTISSSIEKADDSTKLIFSRNLPPTESKATKSKDTALKIIEYIEKADKKEYETSEPIEGGIVYSVHYGEVYTASFGDGLLCYNGKWYTIDESFKDDLLKIYNEIDETK